MDIIDFLMKDHMKLQREMVAIHRDLFHGNLRQRIRRLIESYELHESIEEELLFPKLEESFRLQSNLRCPVFECADKHKEIWGLLGKMMDCLNSRHCKGVQQAFFEFSASAEAHIRHEERVLFPMIREIMDRQILEDLAGKAKERCLTGPQQDRNDLVPESVTQ